MKAILDNKLRLKKADLSSEQLRSIRMNYEFEVQSEIIQIYSVENDMIVLPPNPSYLESLGFELEIDDRRCDKKIDSPKPSIKLRSSQEDWDRQLEEYEYNGIITANTGEGKSAFITYLQSKLRAPMLFIASQNSYLISFYKEVVKFHGNDNSVIKIDGDWSGEIKPIMLVSVQLLNMRKDIRDKLYDNVSLVVNEEVHKFGGNQFREAVNSINAKYRIGLSATPNIKAHKFTEAAFTPNFISSSSINKVAISVVPIHLEFPDDYNEIGGDFMSRKRAYMTNKRFVQSLGNAVEHIVKDRKRQVMVYNDLGKSQRAYKETFDRLGIKSTIVNKDTPKKDLAKILQDFEDSKIQVLIGANMLTESLSLYKLSVIILTNQLPASSFGGRNALIQTAGRGRRKDDNICDHKKIIIDLIFSTFEKYYQSRVPVYQSIEGIKITKQLKSNNTDFDYILKKMG